MSRAWPFEHKREDIEPIRTPEQFVARSGEGTEAVVIRIGLHDAQLVLVGPSGAWQRWVHPSVEAAEQAGRELGVQVHVGEYPEATRVRINSFRRPARDYEKGAYPEQGEVGPVIAYPENRPRQTGKRAGQEAASEK